MMLKMRILLAGCLLALGMSSPRIAQADSKPVLNLFIWSSYIDPALLTAFEKKYNVKVVETDYASNAEMSAKLKAGGDSQYELLRA
jgi:spermidine/putrescine transport system substrate-binding protein